jgi:hypothetical protein
MRDMRGKRSFPQSRKEAKEEREEKGKSEEVTLLSIYYSLFTIGKSEKLRPP